MKKTYYILFLAAIIVVIVAVYKYSNSVLSNSNDIHNDIHTAIASTSALNQVVSGGIKNSNVTTAGADAEEQAPKPLLTRNSPSATSSQKDAVNEVAATVSNKDASADRIIHIEAQYAADFSDDKVLIGSSHNVFIGKVVRQIGNKERGISPETQFEVAVIDNIKGDLHGTVTVDQQGGYKDGTLYVVGDDMISLSPDGNGYLLQPGSTYLFATRYNPTENWYTLNSYPTAIKLLSADGNASDVSLKARAESDPRVQQLKAAYPHEILIDADVAHHNTRNSYVSVQAANAQ